MADEDELFARIKALIVDTLGLEKVKAEDIETDAPLFVDGLRLDSIDSHEIAVVLEEHFEVTFNEDPEVNGISHFLMVEDNLRIAWAYPRLAIDLPWGRQEGATRVAPSH